MPFGAIPQQWVHFSLLLGLTEHMLPVVSNPNAEISSQSAIRKIGQIPSVYNKQGHVAGFPKWTEHISTQDEIDRWLKRSDYGICLQTRYIRALDCDLPDENIALKVWEFLQKHLPTNLPTRGRSNSSKFLRAFKLTGEHAKRVIHIDAQNKIEFLADGQQFIAIGTHPSGVPYEWAGNLPMEIPELTPEQFEILWSKLDKEFSTSPSTTEDYKKRNTLVNTALPDDPFYTWLFENNLVLGTGAEDQAYVSCPFKENHTKEGDKTETVYFPRGSRGYDMGHWSCLHASCAARTDEDFINKTGYSLALFDDLGALPEEKTLDRFDVISAGEFARRPPIDWIIKGVLPKAKLALAYGGSGDGKTFVILDMVFAVTRGVTWNDKRVNQGRVVYICAEGAGGFTSRLNAYSHEYRIDLEDLPLGVIPSTPNFRTNVDVKAIAKKINLYGQCALVVVDTLAQVTAGADENAGKDMGVALKNCELLHELTGALVLLVHHAGKDPSRGARGWSGLKAPLDAEFEISREGEIRKLWVEKMKDGRDGFGWTFQLVTVPVGMDSDGDVIDSCFVRYQGDASSFRSEPKKIGKNERVVLQGFETLGGTGVKYSELVAEVKKDMPWIEGTRDRRADSISQAVNALAEKGEIIFRDGWVLSPV